MKSIFKPILAALLALTTFCTVQAEKHYYELHVGEFNKLNVLDNVNVVWQASTDSAGFIRFYGEDRFADAFILENNHKGTLKIRVATDDVDHPDLPTLYISSSYLTEVKSSSTLTVTISEMPPAAQLKFRLEGNGAIRAENIRCTRLEAKIITGNGSLSLQGECQDANLGMYGTGEIRANDLQADNVNCTIMGTGSIYTWPSNLLKVKGVGSTKIYYRGTPAEIKKVGGGKLIPLEQPAAPSQPYITAPARPGSGEPQVEEETDEMPVYVPERQN